MEAETFAQQKARVRPKKKVQKALRETPQRTAAAVRRKNTPKKTRNKN